MVINHVPNCDSIKRLHTAKYGKQSIDQSDIDAVVQILKGDWLTQGPAVETFENDLKSYFGAKHACAVANGTAALHLTALVLDWQAKDFVITTKTGQK